jgi:hypothetical protein
LQWRPPGKIPVGKETRSFGRLRRKHEAFQTTVFMVRKFELEASSRETSTPNSIRNISEEHESQTT